MSLGKIGDLYEIPREVKFEWKIKDFSHLSTETNVQYKSPKFFFSGAAWEIRIYPNGEQKNGSDGWISLYIARMSTGFPLTVDYSFSFKVAGGKTSTKTYKNVIDKKHTGWGVSKFMMRSVLLEKKADLVPSDVLTVICSLKNSELTNVVSGSFFSRLQEMSDDFKEAYTKGKNTDLLLKVSVQNIGVHRMVLQSRSHVFAEMFSHDINDHEAGVASVNDMDECTLKTILRYMYSADIGNLTTGNALSLYAAAIRYDIKEIKEICLKFILENLSVEWVCDVIRFAETHKEEEIGRRAKNYFKANAEKILESGNWSTFSEENHDLANELVASLVKGLLQSTKSPHYKLNR